MEAYMTKIYSIRFNEYFMQKQYESLIKNGYHWKQAEKIIIKQWREHGY
jgi:hypothetical protein